MGTNFKATFRRDGGRASWNSDEETGERTLEGPAFYLPLEPVPELDGLLVRAALQHGGRIALLPAGEARVDLVVLDGDPLARISDIARSSPRCTQGSCSTRARSTKP